MNYDFVWFLTGGDSSSGNIEYHIYNLIEIDELLNLHMSNIYCEISNVMKPSDDLYEFDIKKIEKKLFRGIKFLIKENNMFDNKFGYVFYNQDSEIIEKIYLSSQEQLVVKEKLYDFLFGNSIIID